ncbi:hypothetical protein ACQHIV_31055 [Kribbella sp. GL6]|uniref:hypothetical protein n=1 Tax=Kribbella sp. GL6 TaxID=3419765 RepID=UPI003D08BCAD
MDSVRRFGVVVVSFVVGSVLAAVIAHPAHPPAPAAIGLSVLAGLVGVAVLASLSRRLQLPTAQRAAVLALLVYLVSTISNDVEAVLFIRASSALIPLTGAVIAVALAVPTAILFPPASTGHSVGELLRATLASRRWWSWTWRLIVATLAWVPVYLTFAALDAPFVHRYYHESGTKFTVPSTSVVMGGELIRGVLHALVLGAFVALIARSRRGAWLAVAVVFAAFNAWLPLIQRTDWPVYLRTANALEITCAALVYGGLVAVLLIRRRPAQRRGYEMMIGDAQHAS